VDIIEFGDNMGNQYRPNITIRRRGPEMDRRGFLALGGLALGSALGLTCFGGEDEPMSTTEAYGSHWKGTAEAKLEEIMDYNRNCLDNDPEKIAGMKLDAVLQELPYLREQGLMGEKVLEELPYLKRMGFTEENDVIPLGKRYALKVVGYKGPERIWSIDTHAGGIRGVEVEVELYENGEMVDLSPWNPSKESRTLHLQGQDWSVEKILKSRDKF
jgi:hypothetical protein